MPAGDGVTRITECTLRVASATWDYARANSASIEAAWRHARAANPAMFNGVVHLLEAGRIGGADFSGTLVRTDFKSYLHWRAAGFPEAGVRDAFGSALIRSNEGHVVLGRQREGNVNSGLAYLPGGFIDESDVAADASVDIGASILRELVEETGIAPGEVSIAPGFLMTRFGPHLSFARELVSPLPAEALRARILSHIATDPASELVDVVIIRKVADIVPARVHGYARLLLADVLR
jgi:8-oxo-dGTP pyrophosphatase MutT (NUDIX family)